MKTKLKGIIYYRVSTEDQAQFGVSLEQQKKSCLNYAETNGIEIIKMFHDDGVSAKTADRPSLQAMLQFCTQKGKGIDCVIVYKIDRLTRNVNDYTNILLLLKKLGIRFISTSEAGIDDTPIGKFIGNLMASSAQLDNEIKSQRITDCMREKVEQGFWCWKAKIGYTNTRDEFNKKVITLDKNRAPLIKWAFEEYATGLYTLEDVRRRVNDKGLRSWMGKEISPQLIYRIITNKFYIGIMTVRGREYEANHERLIDAETFYKCQNVLNGHSRSESISRNQASECFPLRHEVICGYCGRPLTAYFSTGKCGGKFPYYGCYNKNCPSKKSIPKKKLEKDFLDYLKEITPKDKFLKGFKAVILDVWESEYKKINQERQDRIKRIEGLKQEKLQLIEMKKRDLLPDDDFKEAFNKLNKDIDYQEANLTETKFEEFNLDEAIDYVFTYIKTLPENWERATFEQKIQLQGLVFPEKPSYDYIKFQTPKLSPILQTKRELALASSPLVPPRGIEPRLPG